MFPASPPYDALNGAHAYIVGGGNALGAHGGEAGADFFDGLLIEQSVTMARTFGGFCILADPTEGSVTMDDVILGGNNFEIIDTVIIFDSVDVVDVVPFGNDTDECFGYQSVNLEGFDMRSSGISGDSGVTVLISTALNDAAASANDPAIARDLVSALYIFPDFHNSLRMGSSEHHTGMKG